MRCEQKMPKITVRFPDPVRSYDDRPSLLPQYASPVPSLFSRNLLTLLAHWRVLKHSNGANLGNFALIGTPESTNAAKTAIGPRFGAPRVFKTDQHADSTWRTLSWFTRCNRSHSLRPVHQGKPDTQRRVCWSVDESTQVIPSSEPGRLVAEVARLWIASVGRTSLSGCQPGFVAVWQDSI